MTSNAAQFGSLLREARRRQGLSQAELGGDTYSGSYISHLESGRRSATPEVIDFLSRRLGVSPLEWGVAPEADPARQVLGDTIEDLLVAERAWSNQDWDSAIIHAARAADLAAAAGDAGRNWEARYVQGQALFSAGQFAAAAELAAGLVEHETAQKFAVARAQALSLASVASRACDHLGRAVAFGARAVEAGSVAPPIILAEALMALVSSMFEAGSAAAESAPYLARLTELSPRLTSAHSKGTIAWTAGVAAFMSGDIETGLSEHARAFELLDRRRDARLWLRFHSVAARWRLNAKVLDGVEELLQTASLGLQIVGNTYDVVELRQVEAMFALRTGEPAKAAAIINGLLEDPVLGAAEMSLGGSQLLLAHALLELGEAESARQQYRTAALQFETEGRLRAALDAWRRSAGMADLDDFLTLA